jgi:crotonobetainyl-CoA:carnitine CoA-transferase CaiB-like acyl-CoA transferase
VGNDGQYTKFCEVAGRSELATDPRFARNADRVRNRAVLVPILEELVRARPVAFWTAELERVGIPCGPINSIAQALADPQIVARGLRVELPHPLAGTVALVGTPLKMSASPPALDRAPPTLGQHTEEVLRDLAGIDAATLAALRARRIV